jgi:hypothetical protein
VKINKIETMYVVLIEISQGIKTFFIYLNPYLKTILNLPLFLEELILENKITKYYFAFIQTYARLFAKEMIPK